MYLADVNAFHIVPNSEQLRAVVEGPNFVVEVVLPENVSLSDGSMKEFINQFSGRNRKKAVRANAMTYVLQ